MADIKALKDSIWLKKEAIKREEEQLAEWTSQSKALEEILETSGPNPELDAFKEEISSNIATHEGALARLRPELTALEAQLPTAPQPAAPKFDPEKHPLLRKATEKLEPEKPVTFSPGDIVEAQWTDRSWYKAKIQSVLGSSSAPKYLVRFIEYDDSITVDGTAVRPLAHKRKREQESAAAPATTAPPPSNPHVISGPASINPNAHLAKKVVADEEVKPKSRIANKGQLKKRKDNWADFQAKVGKKMPIKDSMFRTTMDAGSKVGFTGSGKGMTETHKRTRYNHKADAEKDEEFKEAASRGSKRF